MLEMAGTTELGSAGHVRCPARAHMGFGMPLADGGPPVAHRSRLGSGRTFHTLHWLGAVVGSLSLLGCGPPKTPYPAALDSERPEERAMAARYAAEIIDKPAIPLLVDRLEDEDEAVRFYAILALEKLTGTRMGYDYGASETQRWRAVQAWRRHVAHPGKLDHPENHDGLGGDKAQSRPATPSVGPRREVERAGQPVADGGPDS